jgi:hypothetical protein
MSSSPFIHYLLGFEYVINLFYFFYTQLMQKARDKSLKKNKIKKDLKSMKNSELNVK